MATSNQFNGNSDTGKLLRSRYFPRQLVTASDLTTDQTYFRELWRFHNRLLHGCGVVCGLEVLPGSADSEPSVIVTSGYALSPQGDGILVPEDQTIPIAKPSAEACLDLEPAQVRQNVYYLAIRYQENGVKLMPTVPEPCVSSINCDYSRTQASFEIKCLDKNLKACHLPDIDCLDLLEEGQIFPRLPPTRKEDIPALFTCPSKTQEPWVVLACLHISSSSRLIIDYGERIQILSTQALQELMMTKPCQEETEEEEMLEFTKKGKIATGSTRPNEWKQYPETDDSKTGIFVDVDTSAAGFTKTPVYTSALYGNGNHWSTTGANCIYNPSPTGFRIYIRWWNGGLGIQLIPSYAQEQGWHIQWIGVED
jgi:hypothetical protein